MLRQMLRGLRRLRRHSLMRRGADAHKQVPLRHLMRLKAFPRLPPADLFLLFSFMDKQEVVRCAVRLAQRRGVSALQQLVTRCRHGRFAAAQVHDVSVTAAHRRVLWRLLQLLKLRYGTFGAYASSVRAVCLSPVCG